MKTTIFTKLLRGLTSFLLLVTAVSMMPLADISFIQGGSVFAQDEDEDGRRAPPEARSSQTLGRRVFTRINEVMELRDMELFDEALAILDEIKEDFDRDRLNDREKFVMWQFYANIYQVQEKYDQAITAYEQILVLPGLTQEQMEQTMFYLGSLYYVQEQFREAINTFNEYNEIVLEPNEDSYFRIGTAHYQLEEFQEAIPNILRNMEILRSKGEMIPKNTYDLLRALYFSTEDYAAAYQVLRESVVLFNDPDDWVLLPAVLGQIERFQEQARSYYVAEALGYLDSDSQLINLAAQLYNNDYPYGCARIMERGMADGIIPEDEGNLSFLSTCYQIAREDEKAVDPLERAAAMSDDGELYARLGRIYSTMLEWEKSLEAFNTALEMGGIERTDQVYLSMARSYMELNRYDEGIQAARNAQRDERSEDTGRTWVTVLTREKERYETLQRQRRDLAEFFR